jgi:hypothetical protein
MKRSCAFAALVSWGLSAGLTGCWAEKAPSEAPEASTLAGSDTHSHSDTGHTVGRWSSWASMASTTLNWCTNRSPHK